MTRLSSENIHATSVAAGGRAVLLVGPAGSGKSDLALRLIDRGFTLVSDDRTLLRKEGGRLIASAPATIAGKIEIRGLGILAMDQAGDTPVALVVDLTEDGARLPDEGARRAFLGLDVPLVCMDARAASAAAKVVLALDRLGLQ